MKNNDKMVNLAGPDADQTSSQAPLELTLESKHGNRDKYCPIY